MYKLGNQFSFDYEKAKPNEKNIVQGKNYRFTILTDRLIRMEYSEEGLFEDRPTELVWYRDMPKVDFKLNETNKYLEISTKYFRLTYRKERPFKGSKFNPKGNLKVELINTDRVWYYGHPEVRNYGAPGISLDDSKKLKLKKGLYSVDGFASIDDSKSNVFSETGDIIYRNSKAIDVYLFMYLKDFALCLKDYYGLTGKPALIPRYALGNWWSRDIKYDDESLNDLVLNFEEKEIPLSVVLLDKSWHLNTVGEKTYETGFSWNNEYFANPKKMIDYLHKKGVRLGLNVDPMEGILPYEKNFDKVAEYLKKDENGAIPFNVLDPKTVDVYLKVLIHPLDQIDVDFYWINYEEKEKLEELFLLDHYHFNDMKRDYKRRPMILSRNNMYAPHRYPVLYSGKTIVSWDTLKMIPIHNASATNIGCTFWSHDIGGYHNGIEDNELYTRFVQLGVFSPILKFGSSAGKYYKREPWKWGIKTYEIVKDYLQLRHRLIPYLYAESYKYHEYGMPLIMPVYYNYPEMYDDKVNKNGYFFGSEFYICPIINKKDYVMNRAIHKFFLPDGVWYDFVTGKKFLGGQSYVSFFKDQDYPVFAKAGSIITLGDNENLNDTTPPKDLEIQIFPGKSNTYNLYEDDGVSDLYRKEFYLLTSIDYNYMPNNYTVIVRPITGKTGIVPERRNYRFVFRNTKKADEIVVYFNEMPIEAKGHVEGTNFVVEVKNVESIGQLTVNCKGKDIEIDALRLINQDIESIISDLQIETKMKDTIDKILFSDLPIRKKRIEIRKLRRKGLEHKFVKLFLKLLEYVEQV